jgi:hypothetical protein
VSKVTPMYVTMFVRRAIGARRMCARNGLKYVLFSHAQSARLGAAAGLWRSGSRFKRFNMAQES